MIILPPDNNNDNNSSSNPGNVSIPSNPPGKKERLHNTTTSDTKAKNPRNSKGKKGTCKIKTGGNPANYPTASQKAQRGLVSKHDSGIVMTPTKNQKPSQQIQRKKEDSSKSRGSISFFSYFSFICRTEIRGSSHTRDIITVIRFHGGRS